ncbi:MAG: hypothetical protein U9P63_01520 [Patescibacteria group bacterium]|nr:hypothetical protein [Patescibacteria group bacterium]
MAVLNNITVETSDLKRLKHDIERYLLGDDVDFSSEISFAKRQILRQIRNREYEKTGLIGSDMSERLATVKDIEGDEPLKDKVIFLTIYLIMNANGRQEEAEYWNFKQEQIELEYTITSTDIEEVEIKPPEFSR